MNGQKAFHSDSEVIKHPPTSIGVMGAKLESNMIEGLIRYVSGGGTKSDPAGSEDDELNRSAHLLPDNVFSAGLSTHGLGDGGGDEQESCSSSVQIVENGRNSCDSAAVLERLSNIPLHVRARAEAWEIPRSQMQLTMKIGEGEGGVVYKCKWRGLDCAAKLLSQDSQTSVAYHDMVNEISIISHLRHPNLVLFLGACTVGNGPLLILSEFMAGGSLEDRFKAMNAAAAAPGGGAAAARRRASGEPWRPEARVALRWILELSRAVCFLHSCTTPIIHRDLKPANLLLTEEDHLKVSDFGLCKTLMKVKDDGTPYMMTGNTGTKRYMAPEVVQWNPEYNEKVDIYSCAMIAWFILVGVRPFEGLPPDHIADLTSRAGLRPPTDGLGWPEMSDLIARMWAHAPADRPSAREIVAELGQLTPPRQPPPPPRCAHCRLS